MFDHTLFVVLVSQLDFFCEAVVPGSKVREVKALWIEL
jgi:hypothetical protein